MNRLPRRRHSLFKGRRPWRARKPAGAAKSREEDHKLTRLARTILALAFGVLIAVAAGAQHHVTNHKVDYDDPGGGDPDVPEGCAGAPNKVQITGSSTAFSPSTITIDAGQAVCWTWSTSVSHNLRANDGSFSSGEPTSDGDFQRTFNTPGTYGYHCQVHGSATSGMRGTVVVRNTDGGGGGTGPGTLAFDPAAYTVDEDAGNAQLTVVRSGGSDGKVTVKIATGTGSAAKGKDFTPRNQVLTWNPGDDTAKTFSVPIKNDSSIEADESFVVTLSKVTGGATIGTSSATVTLHDDDSPSCAPASLYAPAGFKAAGVSGREIRLSWAGETSAGADTVRIERRGGDGAFREIAAVPAGSTEYVDADLPSGTSFHYRLRAASAAGLSEYSEIAAAATDGAIGPCAAGGDTICLGGGRFEAKAVSRLADGEPLRPARRVDAPAAARAGFLALAGDADPQLIVKVADGCATNQHFWVELAAVTDVELEVSVRDTQSGRTWAFYNPAGRAAGVVRDLDAFGTCP